MSDKAIIETVYLPLPADLWAQAAYLTMRPAVVREQASAMLVRVAQMMVHLAAEGGAPLEDFHSLPEDKQAWILGLVQHILARFGTPSR